MAANPIPAAPPQIYPILPGNITTKELKDWYILATKVSEQMFQAMKRDPKKLEEYIRQQTLEKLKNVPYDPVILGISRITQATAIIYIIVFGIKKLARL